LTDTASPKPDAVQFRNVVDRVEDEMAHGHRETRKGDGPWAVVPRSDHVLNLRRFWFQKSPRTIMREDMGFETSEERANEFSGASDSNPALWYHLAASSPAATGDEALKWIMGALAAEINARSLRFRDIPSLMPAALLAMFVEAVHAGRIDRTFTKGVFAKLLDLPRQADAAAMRDAFEAIVALPEFKAMATDDLQKVVEGIVAANPDQFAKAKENPKLVQWFVGQAMKATQGKASAPKVIEIVNGLMAG
jgi:Asp-tRNA(Asn)/Glu-tRNA(Gln) amidotransferase B subunit